MRWLYGRYQWHARRFSAACMRYPRILTMADERTFLFDAEGPCGCGSGRTFKQCHLVDNRIVIAPKDIQPPGRRTVVAEPGCLFHKKHNCTRKLSRDHIISAGVLRELVRGAPDQRIHVQGFERSFAANIESDSLQTKYLCARHNNALSPIDSEVARFIRTVKTIEQDLFSGNPSPQRLYLFSGYDIERWLLKTMCGFFFANTSELTPRTHALPDYLVDLFYSSKWPAAGWGLYFAGQIAPEQPGKLETGRRDASVSLHGLGPILGGATVQLAGLPFAIRIAGTPDQHIGFPGQFAYRPTNLVFHDGDNVITIVLGWEDQPQTTVWFSRTTVGAPVPDLPASVA